MEISRLKSVNILILLSFISFLIYTVIMPLNLYEYSLGKMPLMYSILMATISLFGFLIFAFDVLNWKISNLEIYDFSVFSFMVYIMFIIIYDYQFEGGSFEVFHANIAVSIRFFSMYFIGRYFIFRKYFLKYLLFGFTLSIIIYIINVNTDSFHILLGEGDKGGYYLTFGDSFALLSIMLISKIESYRRRIFIMFFSILVLFLIYSRSSLYIFVLVQLISFWRDYNTKQKIILFFTFIIGIVVLSYVYDLAELIQSRMLSVLFTGEDQSLSERAVLFQKGLDAIMASPIIGDYAGQFYTDKNFGGYIHGVVSFYRQFGFPAVLFLIYIFGYLLKHYFLWMSGKYNDSSNYIFYIGIFVFLEIIIARTYTTLHFWFALGLFSNLRYKIGVQR